METEAGAYLGGGGDWDMPPWRRRRPASAVGALDGEDIFWLLRPKKEVNKRIQRRCSQKAQQNFQQRVFPKKVQQKSSSVTVGAHSTGRPLGNNVCPLGVVPPLTIF